ncbi:MAG: helix-turn-helix transcriptional regulator [Oscillospiraceae bacterium]|nr:helix-turn-helix transcriptional regulator [Oscillospiraceae bacterium]
MPPRIITPLTLPLCCAADELTAPESFLHADRILPYYVCDYVEEGAIYVTEDGTDYTVTAGQMLFLDAGVHHWGKRRIERGTHWRYAHFYLIDAPSPGDMGGEEIALPKLIVPDDDTVDMMRRLSADFPVYGASQRCSGELMMLLSTLAKTAEKSLSDRIAEYLSSQRDSPFSAADLERRFYLSYRHLAHVFKADRGITMQQYHDEQKFAHAAALLRSTLLPVGEIAAICGFADPLYFSRRFHAHIGMAPLAYRRSVKGMM